MWVFIDLDEARAAGSHSEDILCFVGYLSPCMKQCFKWEGNQCKYLQIHNVWFCWYTELVFTGMDTFWILVLCVHCAVCVRDSWTFPRGQELSLLRHLEALELPDPGAVRNKCLGKGSLRVPWLYLLTVKGKHLWCFCSCIASHADCPGKREFLISRTSRKIYSEILNQLKKGKNTPWLQ